VDQRGNTGRRTALLAAGLVLGLALVGLAAGERWRSGEGEAEGSVPTVVVDAMLVIGAMLGGVTMVLFAMVYGGMYGSVALERKRRSSTMRVLTSVTIVIVAIFAVVAVRKAFQDRFGNDGVAPSEAVQTQRRDEAEPGADGDRTLDWRFVGGAFAVALVGSAYAARLLLRNAYEPAPEDTAQALAAILDDTLEDLKGERDPRRAVVAAYASMERALAAHGLPRRSSEAPLEYLERALEELSASASSASRLTRLFEWARFSDHRVEPGMKEEAIEALEAVRAELTAPLAPV
jgi:MFS family permease